MAIKEKTTIRVAGSEVVTYPADADFTTDAIEWSDFRGFALNVWFPTLIGGNPKPALAIEVSNISDVNSFTTYNNYFNLALPSSFTKLELEYKYIRFVYDSTNVLAGSTITFDLKKSIK